MSVEQEFQMKLNIHTGASFVIARRGQGYNKTLSYKDVLDARQSSISLYGR